MKIKRILTLMAGFVIILYNSPAYAQIKKDSLLPKGHDSSKIAKKKYVDTVRKNIGKDTFQILKKNAGNPFDTERKKATPATAINYQGQGATAPISTVSAKVDTGKNTSEKHISSNAQTSLQPRNSINELLINNRFINIKDAPVFLIEKEKRHRGKEFLFYSLCIIVLILGIFKTIYSGYFNNLFRVFFNTSLRQTQLADQLLQAKFPSFLLNIFFTLSAGVYLWLLFVHFNPPQLISRELLLPFCILSIALLYFIKYCLLKFMGWLSDIQEATDNYIFVIFLVNKITGILLLPFIILIAFTKLLWVDSVITLSLLFLGIFFLSRYVKSYGVIEKKISLNPFHFILYILGAEIIPLFILYKVAVDYII